MKYVHFYVIETDEYLKFNDSATEEEIQDEFEMWLDGAVEYGWYITDDEDIPAYILKELNESED